MTILKKESRKLKSRRYRKKRSRGGTKKRKYYRGGLNDNDCTICYEEMKNNNICTTLCGHKFHHSCMLHWLSLNNSCPICRGTAQPFRHYIPTTSEPVTIPIMEQSQYQMDRNEINRINQENTSRAHNMITEANRRLNEYNERRIRHSANRNENFERNRQINDESDVIMNRANRSINASRQSN